MEGIDELPIKVKKFLRRVKSVAIRQRNFQVKIKFSKYLSKGFSMLRILHITLEMNQYLKEELQEQFALVLTEAHRKIFKKILQDLQEY